MEKNKKYYLKDEALNEGENDFFRHQDIANSIKTIIDNNTTPFNIAIIGKWGLGKSSLINMITNMMKDDEEKYLVRDINAWKYEKDEIGKALLKELWQGISGKRLLTYETFQREFDNLINKEDKDNQEDFSKGKIDICPLLKVAGIIMFFSVIAFCVYKSVSLNYHNSWNGWNDYLINCFLGYCKNMGTLFVLPLLVWLGKVYMDKMSIKMLGKYEIKFPLETKSDFEIYTQNLLEEFSKDKPNAKIIIIIDDLDRLSLNKIVDALDAIKLFMSFKQCVFIVPFDDEILKRALDKKRIDGLNLDETQYQSEMILDKLFQYKIYMPQLIKTDMRSYAVNICKEQCRDFIDEYCDEKVFEKIIRKILIHRSVSTPRQVKKLINAFVGNVMLANERERGGKVQKGLVSSESGLMALAKVSVLQADFNEFYDLLFVDSNLIQSLLTTYRTQTKAPKTLISGFFDKKNEEYVIKKKYDPLINFLIFTEKYGKESLLPYLYLAQDEIGVLTGDKQQQEFIAAAESGNILAMKKMIEEDYNFVAALNYHIQYSEDELLGNLIISSLAILDVIDEKDRNDISNSVMERLPDVVSNKLEINCTEIPIHNLIEAAKLTGSSECDSLVQYCISQVLDKENKDEDCVFVLDLVEVMDKFDAKTTRVWEDAVVEIIETDNVSAQIVVYATKMIAKNDLVGMYGQVLLKRLIKEVDEKKDFSEDILKSLRRVMSEYVTKESIELIKFDIGKCFKYTMLHGVLERVFTDEVISEYSNKELLNIINCLFEIDKNDINDKTYELLSKLPYYVEDGSKYDEYLKKYISSYSFGDVLYNFGIHNDFDLIKDTIEALNTAAFSEEGFVNDVCKVIQFYTKEQKESFWKSFKEEVVFGSSKNYVLVNKYAKAFAGKSEETKDLYSIFINVVLADLSTHYSEEAYLKMAISIMNSVKAISETEVIEEYLSYILKAITSFPNLIIAAFKQINNYISEEFWINNINTLIAQTNETNYQDMYIIVSSKKDRFSEEKGNLSDLINFYLDIFEYVEVPEKIVKAIGKKYSKIRRLSDLIIKMIQRNVSDRDGVIGKLIDNTTEGIKVISKVIDEIEVERMSDLYALLEKSKKYNSQCLLNTLNNEIEDWTHEQVFNCLLFMEKYLSDENVKDYIEILRYVSENAVEIEFNKMILQRLGRIHKELVTKHKKEIIQIIVKVYSNTASTEVKKECADYIKAHKLSKSVRSMIGEDKYKEYSELFR